MWHSPPCLVIIINISLKIYLFTKRLAPFRSVVIIYPGAVRVVINQVGLFEVFCKSRGIQYWTMTKAIELKFESFHKTSQIGLLKTSIFGIPMPATAHLCASPHLGRQTPICLRRCYSLSCCGTQSPTDWPGSSCRLLRTSSRSLESSLLLWCPWVSSSLRKAEAPPCCPIIGNTWRHGWALKILCPVKEVRHRKSCTA